MYMFTVKHLRCMYVLITLNAFGCVYALSCYYCTTVETPPYQMNGNSWYTLEMKVITKFVILKINHAITSTNKMFKQMYIPFSL